jgi:GcrA cell cycle regulator
MSMDTWTDERVEDLTRLWADGHSTTRIGLALGMSRNAVIGKIHRLKLPAPARKLPVIVDHSYRQQCSKPANPEARREKARLYEKAYRERRKYCIKTKQDERQRLIARGASPYSPAYRNQLPPLPDMTKGELRAMLARAMQNTAAL